MPAIGQASVEAISLNPEVLDAVEKARVAPGAHLGVAELAHFAGFHAPAELLRHGLHAVADAEHRRAELEDRPGCAHGRFLVRGHVAAGENDAGGAELAHEAVADVTGMNLAIHACLAHAARDELGVLGAEVEDQNLLMPTRLGNWGPP
jgi:hypothetical protein